MDTEEILNVYDAEGRVAGARPRRAAKASGLAVGAVNLLLVDASGSVLLQRRPADKENGGRWDKSVGGHVSAGETFEATMAREAGEELFDEPGTPRVRLAASEDEYRSLLRDGAARDGVVLRRVGLRLNLRDVRAAPQGGARIVLYHLAVFRGRTELGLDSFRPQAAEIDELRYFEAAEVDRLLLEGRLAPNMAFLWLTEGLALLTDAGGPPG
jgi:ADP-ribose pyrophosphatase YjhB (NUDIX family)